MIAPEPFWEALAATPLAVALRESMWLYPLFETLHLIGLALLVGSIIAFDLRVLGFSRHIPADALAHHLLPWVWTGFAINAVSGVLLFISDAAEFAPNTALQAKLSLIAVAGLNAAIFQIRLAPGMENWSSRVATPAAARLSAGLSIVLWLAIIVAGRLIAYTK